MATYNITLSDGSTIVSIADGSVDTTSADIPLVGQNTQLYGDDIAKAQLFMLENFAHTAEPTAGHPIKGQLWYDTTVGAETLKVRNLADQWVPMAPLTLGTADSAMPRWNDTSKSWESESQLQLTAAGVLSILDTGLSASVAFSHGGTDFNIAGTATTDINVTGVTAVNMPSLTLVTALAEIEGGTGTDTYATGDVLFASGVNTLSKLTAGTNGDVLTLAAGVPSWVAGSAGVSALNDLSDVTLTTPDTNSILHKTAGDWIDSVAANFGWDGSNLIASNVNGIAAANLIDRSSPGTLAATIFSGVVTFQNNLDLQDNDKILFGIGDDVAMDFDSASGDFDIVAVSAIDFNITGFSGEFRVASPIFSTGGGEMKVLGTTSTSSTNEGFVSVNHNDDGQTQIRMGTRSGSSFSEINVVDGDLNLYATNTLVFNIDPTQTTITEGGVSAMNWHSVSGTNTTSTSGVFDSGASERNVGYNETPEIIVGGAITIDASHIGKFLRRSALTSRVITLDTNTDIPIGGSLMVHNDHTTGTLTIVEGTITALEWIDGGDNPPLTGTRTIAFNSVVTLRKKSSTVWQIWGNGIS